MTLEIVLQDAKRSYYRAGDLLCGVVQFKSSIEEQVQSIDISFYGTSQALLRESKNNNTTGSQNQVWQSWATLCRHNAILLQTRQTLIAGTHVWPFAVRIPDHVAGMSFHESVNQSPLFTHEPPWMGSHDVENHPLPPSFHNDAQNRSRIEYRLHARLIRPPSALVQYTHNIEALQVVKIEPSPKTQTNPEAKNQNLYQFWLNITKTKPLAKWMCTDILKPICQRREHPKVLQNSVSENIPVICICVVVPEVLELRSFNPITVSIGASLEGHSGSDTFRSEDISGRGGGDDYIQIRNFKLELEVHTYIRAGAHRTADTMQFLLCSGSCNVPLHRSKDQDMRHGERRQQMISLFSDAFGLRVQNTCHQRVGKTNEEVVDLGCRIRSVLENHNITPEFSTYNIFRAYKLRFRIKASYSGKNFTCEQRGIPVEVISCTSTTNADTARSAPNACDRSHSDFASPIELLDYVSSGNSQQRCSLDLFPMNMRRTANSNTMHLLMQAGRDSEILDTPPAYAR